MKSAEPVMLPVLSPDLPQELAANTQAAAVDFAWRSFVAVNWPAQAGERGQPDRQRTIGQAGPTVWETWKRPEEVFLPDGSAPAPWDQEGGSTPPECAGAGPTERVFMRAAKAAGSAVVGRVDEAVGGSLTGQNGQLTRFELAFNRTSFDYIVTHDLYNTQGQQRMGAVDFPGGTMEVKAAWRPFTQADAPAVRARYHRQIAWLYTPPLGQQPATCVKSEIGLVGLHVVQKTPDRPQWVWATFEQVDNVPPFGRTDAGEVPYSYNNPTCPPTACPPNQSTEEGGVPTGKPTQVTRLVALGTEARQANPSWQQALRGIPGSPWAYYQLIDVQWPRFPDQPMGSPTPLLNANVTMETYVPESSCMGCHFAAQTADGGKPADYSYLLLEAHPALGGAR